MAASGQIRLTVDTIPLALPQPLREDDNVPRTERTTRTAGRFGSAADALAGSVVAVGRPDSNAYRLYRA